MSQSAIGVDEPPVRTKGTSLLLNPVGWAARRNIHYGWVIVAVMFVTVIIAAGVRSAPGVLIRPLEANFGWSRGEISLALSLSLICFGLAGPLSGRLTERFGLRRTGIAFLVVAIVGTALAVTTSSLWQLHFFWGIFVGLGTGGVSVVMGATVANIWFESRRGLVTGILGGASSAGQLVLLPVLTLVTLILGWRASVALLAVLLLVVVLPLLFVFLRSRPRDLGLTPYGSRSEVDGGPIVTDTRTTSITSAMRTTDFWLLAGSYFVCGFTTMGLVGTHFIPHAVEHGFSEPQAAGILSIMGGLNVVGTLMSGMLCDRYSPRRLLAFYYFFRGLSLLALPFITTMPLMSLFAVVYGFDYIATVPPTIMLTADRFGRRSVGTIFGWISFIHMVGAAVAASLAGTIHDAVGDYTMAIYFASFLALMAAALAFNVNRRFRAPSPAPMAS
jgi:sugar phosphate permease